MAHAASLSHERAPQYRWRIAWLLGIGVLINYFDRVNLSVSHAALFTAFGISNVTFGYLSGAYNWTYALCQLPVGVLLDRFGVHRVGRLSTLLWSVASFGAAVTPNVGGFFAARLLLGVGEASTFPANAKAIGLWFPDNERSAATAIFDAAAKLASAIGVPMLGVLLLTIGWRWSFAATGIISLFYFLFFTRLYRDPEAVLPSAPLPSEPPEPASAATAGSVSLGLLLRNRKVLGLALGMGAYNYVFYLLVTWLPSYLSSALHIDLLHSFLYTGVPWLFATGTDLSTAFLADTLIRRGWDASRVRKTILVVGTTFGLGIVGAAHAHTALRALLWISISIGGLAASAPIGWSVPSIIAPPGGVGRIGGIVNFSNQISGIAAPIITGYIVQATHSYAWAFGVSGIYLVIGIFSYLFLMGRIEPVTLEPAF